MGPTKTQVNEWDAENWNQNTEEHGCKFEHPTRDVGSPNQASSAAKIERTTDDSERNALSLQTSSDRAAERGAGSFEQRTSIGREPPPLVPDYCPLEPFKQYANLHRDILQQKAPQRYVRISYLNSSGFVCAHHSMQLPVDKQ